MQRTFFSIFAILVLVAGIGYAAYTLAVPADPDYRITFETIITREGMEPYVTRRAVRIQKPNGNWQERSQSLAVDGTVRFESLTVGIVGKGVFKLLPSTQELSYLGKFDNAPLRNDPAKTRNSPQFLRDSVEAGEPVQVFRTADQGGSEVSVATNINGVFLRMTSQNVDTRAVGVERGRFDLEAVPNWPVSYRSFNNKIAAFEEKDARIAAELKKELPQ